MFSYTDPVNTFTVGMKVLVKRGELPPTLTADQATVFVRGDGVVDGWTKVYHLSLLIAQVNRPRSPDNCLDFLVGDLDEKNPIEWAVVHNVMRARLDSGRPTLPCRRHDVCW